MPPLPLSDHLKSSSVSRSKPKHKPTFPPLPPHFTAKKSQILSSISVSTETYTDKSPKGSIDAPIIDLINELNAIDGIVTTSSCSGRVAVFVEGRKAEAPTPAERVVVNGGGDQGNDEHEDISDAEGIDILTGSPAGKGGGHWLYVSHDPVDIPDCVPEKFYTRLCGLSTPTSPPSVRIPGATKSPRLIKLTFSPLILHLHVATLQHAKPLLSAAISAGFRESGVQSLKALDDPDAGSTVGIRTAGLGFEAVIGVVRDDDSGREGEVYESLVSEDFLGIMFGVINERFEWNLRRKERFRREVVAAFGLVSEVGADGTGRREWEDRDVRKRRMREEGLRRREDKERSLAREVDGSGVESVKSNQILENNKTSRQAEAGSQMADVKGDVDDTVGGGTLHSMFAQNSNP